MPHWYKLNGEWLTSLKKFTPKRKPPSDGYSGLFAKSALAWRGIELPLVQNCRLLSPFGVSCLVSVPSVLGPYVLVFSARPATSGWELAGRPRCYLLVQLQAFAEEAAPRWLAGAFCEDPLDLRGARLPPMATAGCAPSPACMSVVVSSTVSVSTLGVSVSPLLFFVGLLVVVAAGLVAAPCPPFWLARSFFLIFLSFFRRGAALSGMRHM